MRVLTVVIAIILIFAAGCSSGTNGGVTQPANQAALVDTAPVESAQADSAAHQLWGFYQFTADMAAGTLDVVPLRATEMHLNVIPFLEPPPLLYLTLETLQINGSNIETDIGLRHPFLGLNQFSGFDVSGILISNGSYGGYNDNELVMAGEGDTRLMNPDGYTRWWNPAEFPNNGTIFGYTDGLLGTPDSVGDFNSTLNAYKFYCDDLDDPNDPVSDVDADSRCVFSAGQKNVRHYSLELGSEGLIFNYAVDASWQFPQGDPPWDVPDDFAPAANRSEAWNIVVNELENSLWNDGVEYGGILSLEIEVWDHYNAGMNTVWLDSPGNFDYITTSVPTGGGAGYSTYEIDITDPTPSEVSIDILIGVACEDEG